MTRALVVALTFLAVTARAETFSIGPGMPYEEIADVPLQSLEPGDVVEVHWRSTPYRWIFGLNAQGTANAPVVVRGVASGGALPVIDGAGVQNANVVNGHPSNRGLIVVWEDARYVVIENLELRNAHPTADARYGNNAAGLFVGGDHITLRNLVIHDNGNGLFTWYDSSDITVEGCHFYGNGVESRLFEHNVYTESDGIVFQYNLFEPLKAGARGNNLKDRSNRTVIRYNWIRGGNRTIDLVEPEFHTQWNGSEPSAVYGNVLIKIDDTTQNQVVHVGGDHPEAGSLYRKAFHFYGNTVYALRSGLVDVLYLNMDGAVSIENNIFHTASGTLRLIDPDSAVDDPSNDPLVVSLGTNWFTTGWSMGGGSGITVDETGDQLSGGDPGFVNAPIDFTLEEDSPCVNAGDPWTGYAAAHPPVAEYSEPLGHARPSAGLPDLGAFERSGEGCTHDCGSGGNGASGTGGQGGGAAGHAGGASGGAGHAGTGGNAGGGGSSSASGGAQGAASAVGSAGASGVGAASGTGGASGASGNAVYPAGCSAAWASPLHALIFGAWFAWRRRRRTPTR